MPSDDSYDRSPRASPSVRNTRSGMLGKICELLTALTTFLLVALLELRSTLPYWVPGQIPGAASPLNPVSLFIVPVIQIRWMFSPIDSWTYVISISGGSLVQAYLAYYVVLLTLGGFSLFLLCKETLAAVGLLRSPSLSTVVCLIGGFLYMSQPVLFGTNLYWTGTVVLYALSPLIALIGLRVLSAKRWLDAAAYGVVLAFATAYLLTEDSHAVIVLPLLFLFSFFLSVAFGQTRVTSWKVFRLPVVLLYALVLGASSLSLLAAVHLTGSTQYFFGDQTATNISNSWAAASQTLWLFLANSWYNRDQVFAATIGTGALYNVTGALALGVPLTSFGTLLFRDNRTYARVALTLTSTVLLFVLFYSDPLLGSSIIYQVIPIKSSLMHIVAEGLIPNTFTSLCYSLLAPLLVARIAARIELLPHHQPSVISAQASNRDPIGSSKWTLILRVGVRRFRALSGSRSFAVAGVVALAGAVVLSGASLDSISYFSSSTPDYGLGYLLPNEPSTLGSLSPILSYLDSSLDGRVVWIPGPISIGAEGSLLDRSYYYPNGNNGPASAEFFNYMLSSGSTSLISTENWRALAQAEADVGVKYDIIWGSEERGLVANLLTSGFFTTVVTSGDVTLLENQAYRGMVIASPYAIAADGGLSTYYQALPVLSDLYGNSAPIPFYMDVSPFPLSIASDTQTAYVGNNFTEMVYDLAVDIAGLQFAYSPLSSVYNGDPNIGWAGGDISDAGNYPWTWVGESMPGYTWENSYTVSDGFVYTFERGAKLAFNIPIESSGQYEVLVRTLVSSEQNFSFDITIGDHLIGLQIPESYYGHFTWVDLGPESLHGGSVLTTLTSLSGGAVNMIDIVPKATWDDAFNASVSKLSESPAAIAVPPSPLPSQPLAISLPTRGSLGVAAIQQQNNWSSLIAGVSATAVVTQRADELYVGEFNASLPLATLDNQSAIQVFCGSCNFSAVTVNVWFRLTTNSSLTQTLIGQWAQSGLYNWDLAIEQGNSLVWAVAGSEYQNLVANSIRPGTWYLATAEFGENSTSLFLNGELVDSLPHSFVLERDNETTVGFIPQGSGYHFVGDLALASASQGIESPAQVLEGYESGPTLQENSTDWSLSLIGSSHSLNGPPDSSFIAENLSQSFFPTALLPSQLLWLDSESFSSTPFTDGLAKANLTELSNQTSLTVSGTTSPYLIIHSWPTISSSEDIRVGYSTIESPDGSIVTSISLSGLTPQSFNSLYLSVAGFGTQLILPDSSLRVGSDQYDAYPSYGVTEGFEVSDVYGSSINATVTWYNFSDALYANIISDTGFILGAVLLVGVVVLRVSRRKTRLSRGYHLFGNKEAG